MSNKLDFFNHFYSNTGPLSKVLKNYQLRQGQVEMSSFVDDAVNTNQPAVIEAGTGIGKTIGYLLPLLRQNKKIIISTATKNLQDQMLQKDFPVLQKALGINFNVSLLKGRSNYLCHHRIYQNSDLFFSKNDAVAFSHIESTLNDYKAGDLNEVEDVKLSSNIIHAVTSNSDNCLFSDCKYSKECFVNKARRRAHQAEVVIVNHHLFFSDFFNENDEANSLLPESDVIVFDEAHNLLDLATLYSSKTFSTLKTNRILEELIALLKKSFVKLDPVTNHFNHYNLILSQLNESIKNENKRISLYKIKNKTNFKQSLSDLTDLLGLISEVISSNGLINRDIENSLNELKSLNSILAEIINPTNKKYAIWLERFNSSFSIHLTPVDIKGIFGDDSKKINSNFIFSSATITTNQDFEYFRELTGFKEIKTKIIDSPFDYRNNAVLHLPQNLPNPNDQEYSSALTDYIYPAIKLNGGRTLILTTSLRAIDEIEVRLNQIIKSNFDDLSILRQGSQPNQMLIDQFKQNNRSILIGSLAFWEGVDLIGDDLSLLIIDKLPFKSPDDPVIDARINLMEEKDFFKKTQIPMTSLLIKQGLGRLIRDFKDKGVAIIGDKRIKQKFYGKHILNSLPPYYLMDDYNGVLKFIESMK
jgi:ATP-dependent DNA helicase DinG